MATEYDAADVHGLLQLAVLVDDFWRAETPRDRQVAGAEIRLQGVRFRAVADRPPSSPVGD
jgi:hypothetical protein